MGDKVRRRFLEEIRIAITEFYGNDPSASSSYRRIVAGRHFDRLSGLMGAGRVVIDGDTRSDERNIAPAVLTTSTCRPA